MRTDGRQEDRRDVRVHERASRRERVGRRSRRGREDAAVGLHHRQELVVAIQFEIRDVGRWSSVNDELIEYLKLLRFLNLAPGCSVAVDGTGEAHTQVHPHALVAHDLVEVRLVLVKFKIRQEAQAAQAKGQDRGHDALKKPGGEEHRPIAPQCQDEIEAVGLRPAQIRGPVLEPLLQLRLTGHHLRGPEAFRVPQLGINVDVDTQVGSVARGTHEPGRQVAREVDETIVARLGDDHDGAHRAADGASLQLPRDLAHARRRGHQPRVRKVVLVLDLLENLVDIDGIVEAFVEEAWRLEGTEAGCIGSRAGPRCEIGHASGEDLL